jgi:outer membrane protein assembly factor BamB
LDAVTGEELWTTSAYRGGPPEPKPALVGGVVYTVGGGEKLYALDAESGEELWQLEIGGRIYSSPAVVDGVIYIGSGVDVDGRKQEGYIYAITEG